MNTFAVISMPTFTFLQEKLRKQQVESNGAPLYFAGKNDTIITF